MAGGKKTPTDFKARAKAKTRDAPKKKRLGISARRAHNPAAAAAVPEVAAVVVNAELSDDELIDDEDIEFVRENAKSLSFLSSVNLEKLAKVNKEAKTRSMKNRDKPKVTAPAELSETEDEVDSDDEDMGIVAEDSDSDLEVHSEDDQVVDFVDSGSEAESMDEEDKYEFRNSKSRRVQKRKAMMDGAMGYEQGTRTFEQAEKRSKVSNRLPIKTADGRLVVSDVESDQEEDIDEADSVDDDRMDFSEEDDLAESESEDEDEPKGPSGPVERAQTPKRVVDDGATDYSVEPDREQMTRKEYIVAQQNRLAGLADLIMQNPERGAKAYKLLHAISDDSDVRVKRLGLLTQLGVYCDVLPDYRIRELTEKEKQMKVTKDVRQQRMHEEALVSNYGAYLRQLFAAAKSAMKIFGDPTADMETGVVAARALGELVNAHPHFNFRKDILAALVDIYVQPSSRIAMAAFAPMAQSARLAVLRLFRDDVSGEYSENAVLLASKRIKRLSYRVDPSALRPWLHLRLRDELRENPDDKKRAELDQQQRDQKREQRKLLRRKKGSAAVKEARRALHESKKQAKARKVQQDVAKTMREAEAEVTREERERWFGETLKHVFITYFRILKQKDNIGGLLPAVLEGLAKYAHLISVEFFVDLFHLLRKIMRGQHGVGIGAEEEEGDDDLVSARIGLRTSLLCVLTALHILTGQGEALNLDIKDFFHQVYALLPPLAANPRIEATRMSALSDGTRYTVYLTPADVATRNAQLRAAKAGSAAGLESAQLDEAVWEETVRSEADLLFECLELMFLGRTKVSSITRVAAFSKRLAAAALYWPPRTAVRAVELIHRLLLKYPGLDRMLSSEEQAGCGLYLCDLDDPDMCNPFATCLFELHWLQIHHHASVQAATTRLLEFACNEEKKHRI
ncbi:hypothetical protein IWW37_001675 [Coemansia sp. RSA 2050]|nr:hypothetical protein IWW37_001675 [Coemansia sp. RSA 2050]KAJ2735415.1 hypothetical protein IW152_001641 [Coemansia sp. BCRC 34962]